MVECRYAWDSACAFHVVDEIWDELSAPFSTDTDDGLQERIGGLPCRKARCMLFQDAGVVVHGHCVEVIPN